MEENYELQIINFKIQTSKFKEYSIACNAFTDSEHSVGDVGIPHEKAEKHASFFNYIESQPLVEQRDTKCCLSGASSLSN